MDNKFDIRDKRGNLVGTIEPEHDAGLEGAIVPLAFLGIFVMLSPFLIWYVIINGIVRGEFGFIYFIFLLVLPCTLTVRKVSQTGDELDGFILGVTSYTMILIGIVIVEGIFTPSKINLGEILLTVFVGMVISFLPSKIAASVGKKRLGRQPGKVSSFLLFSSTFGTIAFTIVMVILLNHAAEQEKELAGGTVENVVANSTVNSVEEKSPVKENVGNSSPSKQESAVQTKSISLADVSISENGDHALIRSTNTEDVHGQKYDFAIYSFYGKPAVKNIGDPDPLAFDVYDLGGGYKRFNATVTVLNKRDVTGYIEIYGDNRLLWSAYGITSATNPYDISVDITDVKALKIVIMNDETWDDVWIALGNPILSVE